MAKKKHHDHSSVEDLAETATGSASALPTTVEPVESPSETAASTLSPVQDSVPVESPAIMDRVQAFLALRTELAANLAAEIEATEKKLAELRKTAALLFPESTSAAPVMKEKKPKKPAKPKVVQRIDEQVSEVAEHEAA